MATQKRKDPNEPKKLANGKYDKSDPRYFKWIGRKGGKETLKAKGVAHFQKAACLRHGTEPAGVPAPAKAKSSPAKRTRKAA